MELEKDVVSEIVSQYFSNLGDVTLNPNFPNSLYYDQLSLFLEINPTSIKVTANFPEEMLKEAKLYTSKLNNPNEWRDLGLEKIKNKKRKYRRNIQQPKYSCNGTEDCVFTAKFIPPRNDLRIKDVLVGGLTNHAIKPLIKIYQIVSKT